MREAVLTDSVRLWKVNNDTCADTVYNAIKSGYRLFDGACGM